MFCTLMTKFCVVVLLTYMYPDEFVMQYPFDYNIMVPEIWHIHYTNCILMRQSPIALETSKAESRNTTVKWFNWGNKPSAIKLKNSGHTVMMVPLWDNADAIPYVKVTNPFGHYIFEQLHFHWGRDDSQGSEHTYDGKRFPLEIHVVFYRKDFGSYGDARESSEPRALAVFTLFMQIGNKNEVFQNMVAAHLEYIAGWGMRKYISPQSLEELIPRFTKDFFMYEGSLTTPPCNEIVIYFISTHILNVASEQLTEFRLLEDRNELLLSHNFRPLQKLNGREVYLIK